ncbi:uncharacterized protein J8A68_004888 [[Candida] subhashii]|uniref:GYF domain-containing protein n=1 Tax=[Candida] subhashii TaxID=561895 RepID=A0A8J5Q4V8_9ASCO|nr:uncharacterized protein J8A68_004888 [[Candida] subhashii]KAG7661619.1 hypothetical protein J8A68_004888 [[Candida] subhashii]
MNSKHRESEGESEEEEEVDVLGNDRRYRQRHRNDLRLNYDSDSSSPESEKEEEEDNNPVVEKTEEVQDGDDDDMFSEEPATDKVNGNGVQVAEDEEDEDDMFASDDDEPKEESKNQDQLGSEGEQDIIPQVQEIQPNEDDSEEEVDVQYYNNPEEFQPGQTSKAKKGPKIEAFNVEEETEEGHFDAEGNYIRDRKDQPITGDDLWLNDFKKSDIKKAELAQREREQRETEKLLSKNTNMVPTEALLTQLIELLEPAETPMEALARLNPKRSRKKAKSDITTQKQVISQITNQCSVLMNDKYIVDVYDLTREELMRKYKQETGTEYSKSKKRPREDSEDNEDDNTKGDIINSEEYGDKIWEFKWHGDDNINGPYSEYEMKHWKETYFEDRVDVRKVGETEFQNVREIDFQ